MALPAARAACEGAGEQFGTDGEKQASGWRWPTGQSITLTVGVADEEREPALRLNWAKPIRSVAVNESAL
jgi:hypothetical protein